MRCILEDITTRDTINVEVPTPYLQQIEDEVKAMHGLAPTVTIKKEDVIAIAMDRLLGAAYEQGWTKPVGVRP